MDTAVAQALPALAELRRRGVIGAVGVGMNSVAPLMRFVIETDVDVVMVAGRWILADRTALPLLTECADRGVSVVAAAPFNSGLLSDPDPSDGASFDYRSAPPDLLARARALAQVCRRHATVPPHAAIRFPLRHPAVASVVAGSVRRRKYAPRPAGLSGPSLPGLGGVGSRRHRPSGIRDGVHGRGHIPARPKAW